MRRCVWCGFRVRRPGANVCPHCRDLENTLMAWREGELTPELRVV